MGTVLGKVSVETPKYNEIAKGEDYEVREYAPQIAAEVTYDPTAMKRGPDGGFSILASYIGAVGKPANVKGGTDGGEKIAMTAPVITHDSPPQGEKIAMTAPVVTQEETRDDADATKRNVTMQFILPAKYTSVESAPAPTDSQVKIRELPARKLGVVTFSGVADEKLTESKLQGLRAALEKAGYTVAGKHSVARYNPPWTPGFLRTNEIFLPVE